MKSSILECFTPFNLFNSWPLLFVPIECCLKSKSLKSILTHWPWAKDKPEYIIRVTCPHYKKHMSPWLLETDLKGIYWLFFSTLVLLLLLPQLQIHRYVVCNSVTPIRRAVIGTNLFAEEMINVWPGIVWMMVLRVDECVQGSTLLPNNMEYIILVVRDSSRSCCW